MEAPVGSARMLVAAVAGRLSITWDEDGLMWDETIGFAARWKSGAVRRALAPLAGLAFLAVALGGCDVARSVSKITAGEGDKKKDEKNDSAKLQEAAAGAAKDALALILDNKDRCLSVARGAVDQVGQVENPEAAGPALQAYIRKDASGDLRRAAVLSAKIGRLLPQVKSDGDPDAYDALSQLFEAQRKICDDAIAFWFSPEEYRERVGESVAAFDAVQTRASSIVEITPEEYDGALARYSVVPADSFSPPGGSGAADALNDAPVSSRPTAKAEEMSTEEYLRRKRAYDEEQERLARQRAEQRQRAEKWRREHGGRDGRDLPRVGLVGQGPPTGGSPEDNAREAQIRAVQAWYSGYSRKVLGVKLAMARFAQIRDLVADLRMESACRALQDATDRLLADPTALACPDPTAATALKTTFTELQAGAHACLLGQTDPARQHLANGEAALSQAGNVLRAYGLTP